MKNFASSTPNDLDLIVKIHRMSEELKNKTNEVERLQSSVSFQLGNLIVDSYRSPSKWVRFPAKLRELVRFIRQRNLFNRLKALLEVGISMPEDKLGRIPEITDVKTGKALIKRLSVYDEAAPISLLTTNDPSLLSILDYAKRLEYIACHGLAIPEDKTEGVTLGKGGALYIANTVRPIKNNGYAVRTHHVAKALMDHGLNLTVMSWHSLNNQRSDFYAISGVNYLLLPNPKGGGLEPSIKALENQIFEQIYARRCNCIIVASNWVIGLAASLAARRIGIPVVYEMRGFWEYTRASIDITYEDSLGFKLQKMLETKVALAADHVFTISKEMKAEMEARSVNPNKISLAPNGVTPDITAENKRTENDTAVIGFIGTLTPYEGLNNLLQALYLLKKRNVEFKVLIAGDGPSKFNVQSSIILLNLTDRTTFLNSVRPSDVKSLYSGIDIAVYCRPLSIVADLVEPLKPLEAMNGGAAVVVSDVAPLKALAESGAPVRVFAGETAVELADLLVELIVDMKQTRVLGAMGKVWVTENRSWSKCTNKLAFVVAELTETNLLHSNNIA